MNKCLIFFLLISTHFLIAQSFQKEVLKSNSNTLSAKIDIDIDFDGDIDHFALNEIDDVILLFENHNNDFFTEGVIFDSPNQITAFNVTDLDNDLINEIIIVTNKETLIAKYSKTNLVFQKLASSLGSNLSLTHLITEDMNNDGLKDVICIPGYNNLYIKFNDTNMSFNQKIELKATDTGNPSQFFVLDFDSDGLKDVIYYSKTQKLGYYKNNGNGTFSHNAIKKFDSDHGRIKIVDFDLDGFQDVIFIKYQLATIVGTSGKSQFLMYSGKDMYNVAKIISPPMDDIYDYMIEDIDYDRDMDLVITHYRRLSGSGGFYIDNEQTELHINDGNFNFNIKIIDNAKNQTNRSLSLIKSNTGQDIISFLSYGGDYVGHYTNYLTVEPKLTKLNTDFPIGVDDYFYTDLDNDGFKDLITTNRGTLNRFPFELYQGKGNGTYLKIRVKSNYPKLMNKIFFTLDFDGDEKMDLITTDARSLVIHSLESIDSTSATLLAENIVVSGCKIFDFDNDGDLDILINADNIKYVDDKGYHLTLFVQNGNKTFEMIHLMEKVRAKHTELIDINNDGLMDILCSESKDFVPFGQTNPTLLYVYLNKGNNKFERKVHADNISSEYFKLADFDKDGDLDIISINVNYNKLSVYEKKQNNKYAEIKLSDLSFSGIVEQKIFEPIDMDNDGRLDIILYQGKTYIFRNLGNLQFQSGVLVNEANYLHTDNLETPMYLLDLDNDHDMDFIRVNKDKYIEFLYNLDERSQIVVIGFYDKNENGVLDTTEFTYNDFFVTISQNHDAILFNNENDKVFYVKNNKYVLSYETGYNIDWELISQDTFHILINSKSIDTLYFALKPREIKKSINANITSSITRCNQSATIFIDIANTGTEEINGLFEFEIDSRVSNINFLQDVDTTFDYRKVAWNLEKFYPGRKITKMVEVRIPGIGGNLEVGDILEFKGSIRPILGDTILGTTSVEYKPVLRCSYDPNDKLVSPDNAFGYILENQELTYTIRFQNTGNDTAFTVIIEDTLSNNIDLNSLRILGSSHLENLVLSVNESGLLRFEFSNIYLPDSTTNFIKSQGYVTYVITPKYFDLSIGDSISNKAYIYFDQNPAIITNTTNNILNDNLISNTQSSNNELIYFYPNPTNQFINIVCTNTLIDQILIFDAIGKLKRSFDINRSNEVDISFLPNGIYFITFLNNKNKLSTQKLIKF